MADDDRGDTTSRRDDGTHHGDGTYREDRTYREDGGARFDGTYRESARGGADSTHREGGADGTYREGTPPVDESSGFTRGLPRELAARFRVVTEFPAGAEADVVRVTDAASREQRVLKLYRRGFVPDEQAVARLAAASLEEAGRPHIVGIYEYGWAGGCWYEVLEYCPHGSLRTLMRRGRVDVTDAIREIGTSLGYVHQLKMVHRDLKPENILVRTDAPLDTVLGDFGIARSMDGSVRWTRAWGTPEYSPPEFEGGEVSPAWDWWSLGMIVAELAGNRHPYQLPDGVMMNDRQIRSALAQRPVDLSAVTDPRVHWLCRGLLTRDRQYRWGYGQVAEWLAGGSPAVTADAPSGAAAAGQPPRRTRRVHFAGRECDTPVALAAALQQNWAQGVRLLYFERDARFVDEVERMLRASELDEALRLIAPGTRPAEVPRRYATFLAELDPELEPVYNGVPLSPPDLETLAADIIRAGGNHPSSAVLKEVRELDILTSWRDLPGMDQGPAIQQRWAAAVTDFTTRAGSLARHGYRPDDADQALAQAWLLLCALDPAQHGRELSTLVGGLSTRDAARQQWWRELRDAPTPTPAALILARLAHPVAVQQTRQQEETARAQRQRAEEQSRQERRAARDNKARRARRHDRTLLIWAVLLAATYLLPHWLGVEWLKSHTDVTVPFPPNIQVMPGGWNFVPQWIFGALVILGVFGLTLMRPPWPGRGPIVFAGLLLLGAAFVAPAAANAALTSYYQHGDKRYNTGPIPVAVLNGTCGGEYWTSNDPVGAGYMRWVLTNGSGSDCATLAAYDGWREVWDKNLDSNTAYWAGFYSYPGLIVAEEDGQGTPNLLRGFAQDTGKLEWTFSCGDGNASYLSGTTYGSDAITVTCARGNVTINPQTGKPK